jgi:putative acetyltransferase
MTIRPIQPSDNTILAAHIREVFEEHDAPKVGTVYSDPTTDDLFSLFKADRSVLWVAEENDEIYGCCGIYPTEGLGQDTVELVKFYIPARYRKKGYGRDLLSKSIESAREMGFKTIYLESIPQYARAISIYEALGFKMIDHPLGNSGHGGCDIWMTLEL